MTSRRPQDLVFTLFGEYLLHRDEPVWVGSLIDLLGALGLSQGAVRTVLSRMVRKGWFETVRSGRRSFYTLTAKGRKLLEEGAKRIYHPTWDKPWDGSWLLISYSIPEDRRHVRKRLRDGLEWLGFGSLGNGLWISPHDLEDEVEELGSALGLAEHLECFHGEGVAFSVPERLVGKCWDLPSINARYEAFVQQHVPEYRRSAEMMEAGSLSDRECFVRRFRLIHEYRQFPSLDPYLPRSLLTETWAGECAAALFKTYHDLLSDSADLYVDSVLAGLPDALEPAPPKELATAGSAVDGPAAPSIRNVQ